METSGRRGGSRDLLAAFLELLALTGLAIALPAYGLASRNTEVFINLRPAAINVVLLGIATLLVPPAVLLAVEWIVGRFAPRVRRPLHAAFLAVLFALFAVRLLREVFHLGVVPNLALVVVTTAGFTALTLRFAGMRTWLRLVAVVPVGALVLCLVASPLTPVLWGGADQPIGATTIRTPHRLVWVVLDEFPLTSILDGKGAVDRTLFPQFAALADTSTWYRNSTTVAPFTFAAVPAMLSATTPRDGTTPAVAANYPNNAFIALSGRYRLHVHEALTRLCPASLCTPTTRVTRGRTGRLVSTLASLWWDGLDPQPRGKGLSALQGFLPTDADPTLTSQQFIDALKPNPPGPRPWFDFLHVLLPHEPWRYDQNLRVVSDGPPRAGLDGQARWTDRAAAENGREYHLRQAQAADTVIGQLRAKLTALGAWDDSVVVVTADHGLGFEPREPARGHSPHDAADLAWTPLFVKAPGQTAGAVDDRLARTTDILPTIADHLGTRLPWRTDGRSLLGRPRPNGDFTMTSWKLDTVPVTDGLTTVDGVAGFARVLASGGRGADCAPALRLYCVGRYRTLMGRTVAGLTGPPDPSREATITNPGKFDAVDPTSRTATWLSIEGAILGLRRPTDLAVVVNGTVAGLTRAVPDRRTAAYWTALAPGAFRPGRNTVEVFAISGPATDPVLTSLGPRRTAG